MKFSIKILIEVAVCLLAIALSAYFLIRLIDSDFTFSRAFWFVTAFFFADGFVLAYFAEKYKNTPPKIAALLLVKTLKFIGLIAFAVIAVWGRVHLPIVAFIVFFAVNYIFYLIYESIILIKLNKNNAK
ncbi:MAG: hypothetical protein LBS01_05545 [Prevotellaceae bacterium]|jgi:hypothetical protein|nr:hypothetical protein [Prevotellaceae bacterium]